MSLKAVLKHTAVVVGTEERGAWVDGERTADEFRGEPFPVVIFIPTGSPANRRQREVKTPQVLYLPTYPAGHVFAGEPVAISRKDKLEIIAPEVYAALGLTDPAEPLLWSVEGEPQVLGKPGKKPKAMLVNVKRVND